MRKVLIFFMLVTHRSAVAASLKKVFEWTALDFDYEYEHKRQEAIRSKTFIPEVNLPMSVDVYEDRLFITVPRWQNGVPASLAYIERSDRMHSPKLRPYPNWEYHDLKNGRMHHIISALRVKVDQCMRLWVIDMGFDAMNIATRSILVFDLEGDILLRNYTIPDDQLLPSSFFSTIAVEDANCDDTYLYLGDCGMPGIIVYSWQKDKSWRVAHQFFHIDPLAGEFFVDSDTFYWEDGLYGLAISKPDEMGKTILYFHPLVSTSEFSVPTRYLKDEMFQIHIHYKQFKVLGSRGPKGQSGASFFDKKTGILFYTMINRNAISCWNTASPAYTQDTQGVVYQNNLTMTFPSDIKVDADDNLWVLSNRFSKYVSRASLNVEEINFRIFSGPVSEAINNTVCDPRTMHAVKSASPRISDGFVRCFLVLVLLFRKLLV